MCDINQGINSALNPSFIVHDSQGYAPGEKDNYDTVQRFIEKMDAQERVADKLHAIWYVSLHYLTLDKKADEVAASRYESECVDCLKDFASKDAIDPPQCVKVSSKEPLIL